MNNNKPDSPADESGTDPRPAAVTFVTTEHFTLQGARAATISESTGRASMFLSVEDHGYTRRIGLLRGYYFEHAPELTGYLLSVKREGRHPAAGPAGRSLSGIPDGRPGWWA